MKPRIWKDYSKDLYYIDTQKQVAVQMCDFDGIQKDKYFGGEPIRGAEVELRVVKLKNGEAICTDEINGDDRGGDDIVVDWIWRIGSISFESDVVPEHWISALIVPVYKGKERGLNVVIIERCWKNIFMDLSIQSP